MIRTLIKVLRNCTRETVEELGIKESIKITVLSIL
jgi:hypothetical protein